MNFLKLKEVSLTEDCKIIHFLEEKQKKEFTIDPYSIKHIKMSLNFIDPYFNRSILQQIF